MKLEFNSGKTIEVIRVIRGGMFDYLHIYINSLSPAEIYRLFDNNAEETKVLTVYEEGGTGEIPHVYRDYIELYGVQKPFLSSPEGTWMVWMQHPMEVVEDVS